MQRKVLCLGFRKGGKDHFVGVRKASVHMPNFSNPELSRVEYCVPNRPFLKKRKRMGCDDWTDAAAANPFLSHNEREAH